MSMSRKHFNLIANVIKFTVMPPDVRKHLVSAFVYELRGTNDLFDADRFRDACMPKENLT